MKYLLACLVLFVSFSAATSAELPQDLADLAEEYESGMRIFGINDDDYEDKNENEFFTLNFETQVDPTKGDPGYLVRVTVQLHDKKTDTQVFAQTEQRVKTIPEKGTGQSTLMFEIPYGTMKRPKMTACAIELGFKKNGQFIPVVTDYDKVDSADEIMSGEGSKVRMSCTKNTAWYRD